MEAAANRLFRRETDRFIKAQLNQQPLDVGADRIARTAHAALRLLEELRRGTDEPIPLAWRPDFSERVAAIEVYPAATLRAHGIRCKGYKKKAQQSERLEILDELERHIEVSDQELLLSNADALDAAVCVLAARDFLAGKALVPSDTDAARREGWIWCLDPQRREGVLHLT